MKRLPKRLLLLLPLAAAVGIGFFAFRQYSAPDPLAGIAHANGRLEFARMDVASLYAGRVEEITVSEGQFVEEGTVLARISSQTAEAQLSEAQAGKVQLEQTVRRAQAQIEAQRQQLRTAQMEADNARQLFRDNLISQAELNTRLAQRDAARAAVQAAEAARNEAQAGVGQARAKMAQVSSVIGDLSVRAPQAGRVEYRLAEPGNVLPAGGKVVSLLNLNDASINLFLPAPTVNQIPLGSEARIKMDGLDAVFPAKVTYIASEAQFTPKFVETAEERTKLMFRVKLQIPADVAAKYQGYLKGGMTATGFVRTDSKLAWPADLQTRLPQ
mgnify:FL=1